MQPTLTGGKGWPGLASSSTAAALPWPYAAASDALNNARAVIQLDGIDDACVLRLTEAVIELEDRDDGETDFAALVLEHAEAVSRQVNAPDGHLSAVLTAEGWAIPPMPRERYPAQIEHVFAVGALLIGKKLQVMVASASVLLRDLAKADGRVPKVSVREALYGAELLAGCMRLSAEAMFVSGRVDMQRLTREQEAEARRRRAAKGGSGNPKKFTDVDLHAYLVRWEAKHGRKHGSRKAAAAHFCVTEAAISKRLKKSEPTS